ADVDRDRRLTGTCREVDTTDRDRDDVHRRRGELGREHGPPPWSVRPFDGARASVPGGGGLERRHGALRSLRRSLRRRGTTLGGFGAYEQRQMSRPLLDEPQ